ncbi:MAG TPA: hydrogenase iron-sulfur subunit [bacterium]|nr:hydrogenase iron-sulfur subunit [bacterium]
MDETVKTRSVNDVLWSPHIIGFACNWCTYAGADLAGTSRMKYPASIRIIRLMCTGRIDPTYILKAFLEGVDGVFVGGCHPGDCHYQSGNHKAHRRIILTRKLLQQFGIEPERLRLEWISASEGARFAEIIGDFTETIRSLGPNRQKR